MTARTVAPNASGTGDGTDAAPWTLAQGLSLPSPGDDVWVDGGVYAGAFVSSMAGTPAAPINVHAKPGKRPVIDGIGEGGSAILAINGADTTWRDIEVFNSTPDIGNATAVNIYGPRTRWVDGWVHDATFNGFGFWEQAVDAEIAGAIVTKNGRLQASNHPHGIYAQNGNSGGIKKMTACAVLDSFDYDLHLYGVQGQEVGWRITDLICGGGASGVLIGASGTLNDDIDVVGLANYGGTRLGYYDANNLRVALSRYYGRTVQLHKWANATIVDSVMTNVGVDYCTLIDDIAGQTITYDRNTYYVANHGGGGPFDGDEFAPWQARGYDLHSTATEGIPPNHVEIKTHPYTPGRALVACFNWQGLSTMSVDLSTVGLAPGQAFTIAACSNPAAPLLSGVYAATPVVLSTPNPFNTFVVIPGAKLPPPPPNAPPVMTSLSVAPISPVVGSVVTAGFSATDTDAFPVAGYTVDWGDGKTDTPTTPAASHIYASVGTYAITVTAKDTAGLVSKPMKLTVTVTAPKPPTFRLTDAQITQILSVERPVIAKRYAWTKTEPLLRSALANLDLTK